MRPLSRLARQCVAALALVAAGCGGTPAPRAAAPTQGDEAGKCKVAASQESPLVTEWPASEKANLESRLRAGGVAVAYSGCSMRLLPQCPVTGAYAWRRTTTSTDTMEIRDADELYSKLPLGAVSLEGELQRSGRIAVQTTVAGLLELRGYVPAAMQTTGACADATHVMGALSVGAFKLRSGGALMGRASADVPMVGGAGGSTRSEESVMREAGDPESCKAPADQAPGIECSSPIQIFLWPLPRTQAEKGPPGTMKLSFQSGGGKTWDVLVGEHVICRTPCTNWFDPATQFSMRGASAIPGVPKNLVDVPNLYAYAGTEGPIQVKAYPKSLGLLAGGITLTTFGALAMATSIALTSVGVGVKEEAMTIGGIITGPVSLALFIPGVWMVEESSAEVKITIPGMGAAARRAPSLFPLAGTF